MSAVETMIMTATPVLPSWWKRWLRPTLVRRLMLAQMAILTLMWSLFVGYVILESRNDNGVLASDKTFEAIIAIADNLAQQPRQREVVLHAADLALRDDFTVNAPRLAPRLIVKQANKIVYQSYDAPAEVLPLASNAIDIFHTRGVRWRARMMQSSQSDISVTIVQPADEWTLLITFNTNGYYLLPLLISLPFLLLPAWLSLRIGLRPWSKVAAEVAARGPHDLTPLLFKPKHQELNAMVDSVNALMQRVDESAARERSFIADAAHELRTPLAAMRINVEALQGQAVDSRQQELLNGILSSGNRATRLVSQLLMLTRNDAGAAMSRHRLALDGLLQDRLASLSALAGRRQVELELSADSDVFVLGNRESLESLIDNLIENAIKYSPPQSIVEVHLRRGADEALLSIADHGPGISAELRERVFDRFFRAPDQVQSGSGLGLAIARSAVLRHGGQIWIHSNDGYEGHDGQLGTRVTVSLPLMPH